MVEFERNSLGQVLGERGYIRGPFGSALVRNELQDQGIPVYEQQHAIKGVRTFRFFIDEDKFKELSRFQVRPNDLIISCSGTVGKISIIRPNDPMGIISQALLILRPQSQKMLPEFLYYFLSTLEGQQALIQSSHGSVQVNIAPRAVVEQIELPVPSLPDQRGIIHILGALDDKIRLNQRMNETLESLARTLFQSWFVDFDPVRAKSEGREPAGMDAETAALFPDSFDDSFMGEIPHGWQINSIKSRASRIQYGLTQSASIEPIGPRFLRITDIKGGIIDWKQVPFCEISPKDHEKYRIESGDIFIARTGASTGDNIYVIDPPDAVFASYLVRFQFDDPAIARIVGEFMKTPAYSEYVAGCIGGSAQPNASAQLLSGTQLVFPTDKIAHVYYQLLRPLDQKCAANSRECGTLMKARDILLPKLLSGEIKALANEVHSDRT